MSNENREWSDEDIHSDDIGNIPFWAILAIAVPVGLVTLVYWITI